MKKKQSPKVEASHVFADSIWPSGLTLDKWRNSDAYTLAQKSFLAGYETGSREMEAHMIRFAGVVSGWEPEKLKNMWRTYKEKHGI